MPPVVNSAVSLWEFPWGTPWEFQWDIPWEISLEVPWEFLWDSTRNSRGNAHQISHGNSRGNSLGISCGTFNGNFHPLVEPRAQSTFYLPLMDLNTHQYPNILSLLPYYDLQSSCVIQFIRGPKSSLPPNMCVITE